MMSFTINQFAEQLGGQLRGNSQLSVIDVAPLESATAEHISYLDSKKQLKSMLASAAGAVLTTEELADRAQKLGSQVSFITVDEPQAAFIEVMLKFRPLPEEPSIGISERAIVDETATLGEGCQVFPNAYIGKNVQLGKNCEIGPGAVIQDDSVLGDDCIVYANAVLYRNVQVGQRVIIHANAVIGADGFGYRFVDGAFVKIPHTGTVRLEDDVEIGAAATVDRGMIGATVIGQGTKLDNQVMIAHNCQIGKHNAFASQVGLAGSCTTGDYVQMGGQVGISDHVNIGAGSRLGGKAGVGQDLPAGGDYLGSPAIDKKEAIRNFINITRLPEVRAQVKQLTSQLEELQKQLEEQTATSLSKSAA
jgi:UDP-3-O-[3-hydroxymyristoyl] glucosamine N-acyltransferase